jgi:amino acid transporter
LSLAVLERLRAALLGRPRDLLDPQIHHSLALIAFFAWVGLGSDGLSSSCYGPEEAFLQLGAHPHLALYLVAAMVVTVFLISASYSQIIELFPSGGGGYLVATKLLGPTPGIVSGSALVVDYVLTIAISVASGCDAIFSFMPIEWQGMKLAAELVVVGGLIGLNLRGVKESVLVLTPIFLVFMVTHVVLILVGIFGHGPALHQMVGDTVRDTHSAISEIGFFGVLLVFLRAYSLGGGTFTGIEAVSNSTEILREPKVRTGKRTMMYMATSLAFTAGGILLCYLLNNVTHQEGRTLNASLFDSISSGWRIGAWRTGGAFVWITLMSEGALLFVAAQTGFLAGPRTLGSMAVDQWVPKRFALLSERLVTQNGVFAMGLAAVVVLLYTHGSVATLVVMYSINVFLTFTLTQLGMALHWWNMRRAERHWRRRLAVAGIGTAMTAMILVVTSALKFLEGGWVTLAVTGVLIAVCFLVRRHYRRVRQMLRTLDDVLEGLPLPERPTGPAEPVRGPTAIVLVEGYNGLGVHTLLSIERLMPGQFKNVLFASVGLVDSGQFKGVEAVQALEEQVQNDLARYVELAGKLGYYAESHAVLGTDLVDDLEKMCLGLVKSRKRSVVFAGQLVFQRENLFTRLLHHETAYTIQRRLQFAGIQVIILPIRVWENRSAA